MATPLVTQDGMLSPEGVCQDAAASNASNMSTDAGVSEDSSEEQVEAVVPLFDLIDHLKSLKGFAAKVIKKCQKSEIQSLKQACTELENLCQTCDQPDRLIVAGNGNVGKSTIGNAFLGGEKFWPTASYCMTSRICEAHYDASSDGKPISKQLVHKSATSQPEEFLALQSPLKVPNPSPFLKPGVILVDLPGLDQEMEYMQTLEKYMEAHPASSVALFYIIDVKNKICNPDRQFLQKLMASPWVELSQKLRLLVNKCDIGGGGNGASSDEETPDYEKLLSDITQEAKNYCTPKVWDLSMKDRKKHETAALKWQKAETDARSAVAHLKACRLAKCLQVLQKAMETLEWAVADDEKRRATLDEKAADLKTAEDALQRLDRSASKNKKSREGEILMFLNERRNEHLTAIENAGVPYFGSILRQKKYLDEIDDFIVEKLKVMVVNDIQVSAQSSQTLEKMMEEARSAMAPSEHNYWIWEFGGAAFWWGLAAMLVGAVAAGIIILLGSLTRVIVGTHVDSDYVANRFYALYDALLKQLPASASEKEIDHVLKQATQGVEDKQKCLDDWKAEMDSHGMLDPETKKECSELQEDFAALKMVCKQTLGRAKDAGVLWAKKRSSASQGSRNLELPRTCYPHFQFWTCLQLVVQHSD